MIKKIKVFAGDTRLKDIWVGASKWEVFKYRTARFLRKLFIVTSITFAVAGIAFCSFKAGSMASPTEVYAAPQVISVVKSPDYPVLARIAACESGNSQTNKDGQVVVHPNTNGTYDIGQYQINSAWNDQATKLGYDLSTQSGNAAMALWIYTNDGTSAWTDSAKCWNK